LDADLIQLIDEFEGLDHSEQAKLVYACFGLAAYFGQVFEEGLTNLRMDHGVACRHVTSRDAADSLRQSFSRQMQWQEGYSAFTVSESQFDVVRAHIRNQDEHHRRRSFEDELRTLLRPHHVDFDQKYLFESV